MIWLSISLFCCKKEWNKLLSYGIASFFADFETRNSLEDYTIEFNYLSGENIRLSLLTAQANALQLTKHTDSYFKKYFLNAGFFTPETKLPVNGIFMPFTANTIQYGLYPPQTITYAEKENYIFSASLSHIILIALKEECIDDETILTFIFYLQMGLIKAINLIYPEFTLDYVDKEMNLDIAKIKFEENKEVLLEITRDIMGTKNGADELEWFKKWLEACKIEMKKYRDADINDCEVIYKRIVFVVYKHLAVTPQMDSMLSYFVEQSFLNNQNIAINLSDI